MANEVTPEDGLKAANEELTAAMKQQEADSQ
jgi:hypothetical protein